MFSAILVIFCNKIRNIIYAHSNNPATTYYQQLSMINRLQLSKYSLTFLLFVMIKMTPLD